MQPKVTSTGTKVGIDGDLLGLSGKIPTMVSTLWRSHLALQMLIEASCYLFTCVTIIAARKTKDGERQPLHCVQGTERRAKRLMQRFCMNLNFKSLTFARRGSGNLLLYLKEKREQREKESRENRKFIYNVISTLHIGVDKSSLASAEISRGATR